MIIRSKAPLRISFGGGGTDVPPYPEERGGAVLSATIDKYAYASLIPQEDEEIKVISLDYNIVAKYQTDSLLNYDGGLDLVKAVIREMGVKKGLTIFMHTDAPPGSGLGTSSAVVVNLIGLFQHWLRKPLVPYEIAQLGYRIEREDLAILGGKQDQYAATFGGFNYIEFMGPTVVVNPLRIPQSIINELEYRLLLCYTGKSRLSSNILKRQIASYASKQVEVVQALDASKSLAVELKNALLKGELKGFGDLLHQGWEMKKRFDSDVTTPTIDRMYEESRKAGAMGGKILGAGGGGYMLLFCEFDKKHLVAKRVEQIGGQVVPFRFEHNGLQTWEV